MKKVKLVAICAIAMLILASCGKKDNPFVGIWGVEKIEYYNIDYAGNPIEASMETYTFPLGDPHDGIDLVFRENKTGEIRDRAIDSLYADYDSITQTYQTVIPCADSTFVTVISNYNYDEATSSLYITPEHSRPYMMKINNLTDNSFVYVNEYDKDYVERAYVKRLSDVKAAPSKQSVKHPRKPGAFLGGGLNQ